MVPYHTVVPYFSKNKLRTVCVMMSNININLEHGGIESTARISSTVDKDFEKFYCSRIQRLGRSIYLRGVRYFVFSKQRRETPRFLPPVVVFERLWRHQRCMASCHQEQRAPRAPHICYDRVHGTESVQRE